ncbi:MAG TPA: recombination mediator RecR [Candidatus Binataceae bacterium]|jgi:recombination protein RecR|nr:recombination mediator RecR [Candidatus Binataceae bacterium]
MAESSKQSSGLPPAMTRLVRELSRLPGIGEKTASRLAFNLLGRPREDVIALAEALLEMKERIVLCASCLGLSDRERCHICSDPARNPSVICVVEGPADLMAMERSRSFSGLYHVLHGALAPLDGIGPDDIRIKDLIGRLNGEPPVAEVVIATNATVEGEATALYLAHLIKPLSIKVTRLARGLPVGGDLEYSDAATLTSAFSGRREI